MVLVKVYMLRLRKILLSDIFYLILLFISIIYIAIYINNYKLKDIYDINTYSFKLTISKIKIDGDKLTVEFKENLIGKYYFKSKEEKNIFNYNIGDKVKVIGHLENVNNNTIPNLFNYKKYLERKGISYILSIDNIELISRSGNIFLKVKNYFIKRIENIDNNEYLYAFILGDSSYIDRDIYNNYKINGVTHLFALSGLHVSMFSSFLLFVYNKMKINEKVRYLLTGIFLIFFSFIASFTPSILRAVIFFILSSINTIYYFYIKPKNLLYLTFIILVIIDPFYIYNTGFILSFTITYFILLFNEKYKINNNILSILVISIVSFISSFPIIINMSYEINIISFFNNIIFIPFVSYIIFPISLLTIMFPFLNEVLLFLTDIMEYISNISSDIVNISIIFSKINMFEIILYYLIYIVILKGKLSMILVFLLFFIYLYLKPYFDKNTYVYFIDVGQGDSALIYTKDKKTIVIDTGGSINYKKEEDWNKRNSNFNLMKDNIILFYKSIGIKKIDYLILSHGDYDHMGETINLVNNFKVEKVIFNCGEYNDLEHIFINVLNKKKIPYYLCIKELNMGNIKLFFLQTSIYDNENDNSNVIYTEINGYKFMFMGDAGVAAEKEIINRYNISNIDVLKVGHHGSKTSTSKSFINKVKPKYSIISVGKNNKYGHPNKEVLNNLENSKIYRTDLDGSIIFKIKNNKLSIAKCMP